MLPTATVGFTRSWIWELLASTMQNQYSLGSKLISSLLQSAFVYTPTIRRMSLRSCSRNKCTREKGTQSLAFASSACVEFLTLMNWAHDTTAASSSSLQIHFSSHFSSGLTPLPVLFVLCWRKDRYNRPPLLSSLFPVPSHFFSFCVIIENKRKFLSLKKKAIMEVGNVFVQRLLLVYSSLKRRIASLTFNSTLIDI